MRPPCKSRQGRLPRFFFFWSACRYSAPSALPLLLFPLSLPLHNCTLPIVIGAFVVFFFFFFILFPSWLVYVTPRFRPLCYHHLSVLQTEHLVPLFLLSSCLLFSSGWPAGCQRLRFVCG